MVELRDIEARITYALPAQNKLFCYEYDPPPGVPRRSAAYRDYPMTIRDGRLRTPPLSLPADGFALHRHATQVDNFYDAAEVAATYAHEIEALVKQVTGASKVLVFDHTVRGNDVVNRQGTNVHAPVMRAHDDYTVDSAPRRVRQLLADERAAARLLRGRFVEINVWRPIRGPLRSWPLAVCSGQACSRRTSCRAISSIRSVSARSTRSPTARARVVLLSRYAARRSAAAQMLRLAARDARVGAHTAFEHPHTPDDALPRESIETAHSPSSPLSAPGLLGIMAA